MNDLDKVSKLEDLWLDLDESKGILCPICGEECDYVFVQSINNKIVGCINCLHKKEAEEALENNFN